MGSPVEVSAQGDCEVQLRSELHAPRALVFEAMARPVLLKRWLGRRAGWTLVISEDDLRTGGAWRFVWYSTRGEKVGMRGVHREVAIPERVVTTALPDSPAEGDVALVTVTLEERGKTTRLAVSFQYDSRAARDRALAALGRAAAATLGELAVLLALAPDPDEARDDA